jgi:L-amino acid N-acyltransferase YncA
MAIQITPMTMDDQVAVIDIFNHHIEHGEATFFEKRLPYVFIDNFIKLGQDYPVLAARSQQGSVLGFGLLRPYSAIPAFACSAEISYFVHPDHLRCGIGLRLLEALIEHGRQKGISTIMACILAQNSASIQFHLKHGFLECGQFGRIGIKHGEAFDVKYFQLFI